MSSALKLTTGDNVIVPHSDAVGFFGLSDNTLRKYGRVADARIPQPGKRMSYDLVRLNATLPVGLRKLNVYQEYADWREAQGTVVEVPQVEHAAVSDAAEQPELTKTEIILRNAFQERSALTRKLEREVAAGSRRLWVTVAVAIAVTCLFVWAATWGMGWRRQAIETATKLNVIEMQVLPKK